MTKLTEEQPVAVSEKAKRAGEILRRWCWVEPTVWTMRMLTALEHGVKGAKWFSLIDKVLTERTLHTAFLRVAANKGAAGVDHVTVTMFQDRRGENLESLIEELQSGRYRPQQIHRHYIPKPGSQEKRPLGIPTVRDRVVQTALQMVLEPIFERDFAEHSYGFRPGRGCKGALRRVDQLLKDGHTYVVDADLKSYFDTIPHDRLMTRVGQKVSDGRVLSLIRMSLEQGVLDGLREWTPEEGTPQGACLSPPQGERRQLDLVARLWLRPDAPPPRAGVTDLVALVHVELESRASTLAFRPRMFDYYIQLRRDTGLPVLPIALFLRVGLDGIGWDAYEEHFWEQRIVRFEYAYVGLPALDGEPCATGENLLGVALSALMRLPAERRAELYAEGLKRIAGSGENDFRRFLLAECLESYAELDETQKERLQALLHTEAYQEIEPLTKTTYERGIERGIEQGERRSALRLMEAKFGPLSLKVKEQVEALSPEALAQLQIDLLKAHSLEELHLDD